VKTLFVSLLFIMLSFPATAVLPEPKILGGQDATAVYPGVGALYERKNLQRPICGGSMVASRWFMTAAHCVYGKLPADIGLYLDSQDLSFVSGADLTFIDWVLVHPQFDPDALDNDIALLHLEDGQGQADWVSVMLPQQLEQLAPGDMLRAVGWGETLIEPMFPDLLQEVDLPLREAQVCKDIYGDFTDNMLCVGEAGGKDTCFGDSGSPLYYWQGESGMWLQTGLTSFGTGDCGEKPGGYTKVSNYLSWLLVGSEPVWQTSQLYFNTTSPQKRLTVTNASLLPLHISYDPAQLQDNSFAIHEQDSDCQAIILSSGASCTITIELADAGSQPVTTTFMLEADGEVHAVALSFSGKADDSGSSGGSWSWAGVLGMSLLLWWRRQAASQDA